MVINGRRHTSDRLASDSYGSPAAPVVDSYGSPAAPVQVKDDLRKFFRSVQAKEDLCEFFRGQNTVLQGRGGGITL